MRISVTGSKGFIGELLVKVLKVPLENQWDTKTATEQNLVLPKAREDISKSSDVIIHLAAISGVKACEDNPKEAYAFNTNATIELAKAAKKAGVKRFIFASSSAVYGETSRFLIDETHPKNPRNVYGRTKSEAEKVWTLEDDNFEIIITRKSNVYGHGMRFKGETVLDNFISNYLANKDIQIQGTGSQRRDFVHIMDVTRLYAKLSTLEKVRSGIYNIGGANNVSMRELANMVNDIGESIFGYRVSIVHKGNDTSSGWHDFRYDYSKAKMEFQYSPTFTLDDYIKERMMDHLRNS